MGGGIMEILYVILTALWCRKYQDNSFALNPYQETDQRPSSMVSFTSNRIYSSSESLFPRDSLFIGEIYKYFNENNDDLWVSGKITLTAQFLGVTEGCFIHREPPLNTLVDA
ncbi:hypothetical protein Ga0123461_0508 [Mariprofundus aestuarium]|uniref:Uncharacterized protein n=1 Tax=Mariprofundus aestuarium TaxID=1921086 RepID=A0A2K8KVS8_MARES|nr:hypothetical protein [Mariprofundus aestuarium]ATX78945.1 hypothetical protein Ga0123461_0508 [Mariprofundus aestuarium]